MMLLNNFFYVIENSHSIDKIDATIKLNANHQIFLGHFPKNPVTPGVVQIQMVKEIIEHFKGKELKLISMSRCKFLRILNPNETPIIHIKIAFTLDEDLLKISASGEQNENIFFKLSATYQ